VVFIRALTPGTRRKDRVNAELRRVAGFGERSSMVLRATPVQVGEGLELLNAREPGIVSGIQQYE